MLKNALRDRLQSPVSGPRSRLEGPSPCRVIENSRVRPYRRFADHLEFRRRSPRLSCVVCDEIESRVLNALQEKLLRQDLFEGILRRVHARDDRLGMEHRANLSAAEREIERIEVRRKKLVESIMDDASRPVRSRTS